MNFMATRQSGGGLYEEDSSRGTRPFPQASSHTCSSPSSSSSHQQYQQWRGRLVPPSFPNHLQQPPRGPWDETSASFQGYSSGGGTSQLDLMMMDSRHNKNNSSVEDGDESNEHHAVGGGSAGIAGGVMMEREHMFDKVVTPSDVGKLNRLVIPKQHAEKYFPLDSSTNEKGLLLNFEDRNGKPWRFRYSYWNSSQSYVMTKGWSRFVKEKKLDAGDIVSFQRGVGELGKDRLFIDWRRRPGAPHHQHHQLPPSMSSTLSIPHQFSFHHPWNHPSYLHHQQQQNLRDHSHLLQLNATNSTNSINNNTTHPSRPHHSNNSYSYGSTVMTGNPCSGPIFYLRPAAARPQYLGLGHGTVQLLQKGGNVGLHPRGTEEVLVEEEEEEEEEEVEVEEPMVFESVPVVQGKAAAKRLRLFGVNMDCPISVDDDNCDIVVLPSTAVPHSAMPSQIQSHHSSSSSSISPLQLRPYNYASRPLLQTMPFRFLNNYSSSSSNNTNNNSSKGKASMSLDFDI